MPCDNEAPSLNTVPQRITAPPVAADVVAVDDGFSDAAWEILLHRAEQDARVQTLRQDKNRANGAATRTALAALSAPVVVIQDADLEYDPTDWPLLLQPVLAVAPPWSMGAALRQLPGPVRRCGIAGRNRVVPRAANHITGLRLTDVATC
ncbi:glycosyltransferase [Limisphaera sp. VF-2]|uniref:glycosyltransferase n=1 Tax=Limisphaera sp. VF-2 TaxID=3400418 RepID=UPI003C24FE0A